MFKLAFLMQYLLNKWMDSDQTFSETLIGRDLLETLILVTLTLFQGHQTIENVEISFSDMISSEQMDGF